MFFIISNVYTTIQKKRKRKRKVKKSEVKKHATTNLIPGETRIYNPTLQKELLIDPETISQFTGKYDDTKWDDLPSEMQQKMNKSTWKGIPIYENDIVLTTYTDNSSEEVTVTYDTDYAGFTPWVWQYECYDCKSKVKIKSVKSIGNRFDNERRVL